MTTNPNPGSDEGQVEGTDPLLDRVAVLVDEDVGVLAVVGPHRRKGRDQPELLLGGEGGELLGRETADMWHYPYPIMNQNQIQEWIEASLSAK